MEQFNIHHAKTHLSRLVDAAAQGKSFIIAKAGKPMVKVVPIDVPEEDAKPKRRLGWMAGQVEVPDDFDSMFAQEIQEMFEGKYSNDEEILGKK